MMRRDTLRARPASVRPAPARARHSTAARWPFRLLPVLVALMLATVVGVQAAPLLNDTLDTLDPNTWTITDSQNRLSATGGRLVGGLHIPPAWNDPSIVGKTTFARVPGRALVANILHRDVSRFGPVIGWTAGPPPADPRMVTHGLLAQSLTLNVATGNPAGALNLGSGQTHSSFTTSMVNTEYLYTIVLRPRGAYYFASTLPNSTHAAWPQASLVWVDNSQTASDLAPFVSNYNQELVVDDLRVVDFGGSFASAYGLAAAADTFTRADGPLSGSSTEEGGGPWAVANGAWAVSNNQLTLSASGSGPAVATVVGAADGIFEMTLQTPPSGPVSAGLVLRASDASNYLLARLLSDRIQLVRVQGGAETILDQTGYGVAPNSLYRLVVRASGSTVRLYVNDREPLAVPVTTTFNQVATGMGVYRASEAGLDGGTLLDEVAAWPSTVTLPSDAGVGPYGGATGTTVVERQPWTAMSAPTPEWSPSGTIWHSSGGVVRQIDLVQVLTKDLGQATIDISADVIVRNTDGYVMAGLAMRAQDSSNVFFARVFHIPNDPTFEVELGQIVSGSGSIPRFMPITGETGLGQTTRIGAAMNGPFITLRINDRPRITYVSTSMQAVTRFGFFVDPFDTSSRWDNWEVKSIP